MPPKYQPQDGFYGENPAPSACHQRDLQLVSQHKQLYHKKPLLSKQLVRVSFSPLFPAVWIALVVFDLRFQRSDHGLERLWFNAQVSLDELLAGVFQSFVHLELEVGDGTILLSLILDVEPLHEKFEHHERRGECDVRC